MDLTGLSTRDVVSLRLREERNRIIDRNRSIVEAKAILRKADREDLLGLIEETRAIPDEYSPPSAAQLSAIEVGGRVFVCTYQMLTSSQEEWPAVHCRALEVLKVTENEICGLSRSAFGDDKRITVPIEFVCGIDGRPATDSDETLLDNSTCQGKQ